MRGFEFTINEKKIKGGIQKGITSVAIEYRDDQYYVFFGSSDDTGMISYNWYSSKLDEGTKFIISVEDILEPIVPDETIDHNKQSDLDKRDLNTYYRLRDELIKQGII